MSKDKTSYTLALLALLTVTAFFLADTVGILIGRGLEAAPRFAGPLETDRTALQPRRELSDYLSILERGLFGDGTIPARGPASAAAAVSYELIGTMEGGSFSGAVLKDSAGQAFYRINEKLPDGSVIVKVMRDMVTLRRSDGLTATIEVAEDTKIVTEQKYAGGAGVKRVADGKFMVDQKEVLASTENLSQILTQARALPYMEHGKTAGFRISEIVPNSIYAKIGLQNGDVIQRVNAQALDDPGKFFQLYQGFRTERNITIDLIRGGQRQTLNYEIR